MGFDVLIPLTCISFGLIIAGLAIGTFFLKQGYRRQNYDRVRVNYLTVGWILTGITSLILTISIVYLLVNYGYSIAGFLVLFSPILLIVIFIVSLSIGISSLTEGYSFSKKHKGNPKINGKKEITAGWIALGITIAVSITAIVLFILLLNYLSNVSIGAM